MWFRSGPTPLTGQVPCGPGHHRPVGAGREGKGTDNRHVGQPGPVGPLGHAVRVRPRMTLIERPPPASLYRPPRPRRWVAPVAVAVALAAAGTVAVVVPSWSDPPRFEPLVREDFSTDVATGDFADSVYSDVWQVYPDGWKDTSGVGTY